MGQPPAGDGFEVDPGELEAHRKKIDDFGIRMEKAGNATAATSNPEAFGLVGIPLALICGIGQAEAQSSIIAASKASLDHADRVHTWQKVKEWDEAEFKNLFKLED
ncbi:hypothetical protein ACFWMR_00605 [Amycolatopsis thailandensis]|uniref:hypothetical protein n=1 Tax=Amycolatopsis thailandensis TaxID=589330 RepID=UPI0036691441